MKRFTETTKWSNSWFRRLSPSQKLFWLWLCDNCDHSGVVDVDFEVASLQVGSPVSEDFLQKMGERVKLLEDGKLLLVPFVHFQWGELNKNCRPHLKVMELLKKHRIDLKTLSHGDLPLGNDIPLAKGTQSLPHRLEGEREDKGKGKEEEEGGLGGGFVVPTLAECEAMFKTHSLGAKTAKDFFDYYSGTRWCGSDGKRLVSILTAVASWAAKAKKDGAPRNLKAVPPPPSVPPGTPEMTEEQRKRFAAGMASLRTQLTGGSPPVPGGDVPPEPVAEGWRHPEESLTLARSLVSSPDVPATTDEPPPADDPPPA